MTSDSELAKYCPLCGAQNPPRQPFCAECKDCDLSTVPVEPVRNVGHSTAPLPMPTGPPAAIGGTRRVDQPSATVAPVCILALVSEPSIQFTVKTGECVGRTSASEVVLHSVPDVDAISGRHARFWEHDGHWYVQHVGSTNFIRVDGFLYSGDEEVAIYDGSIVVLSLTAFQVRLGGAS